jgi:AcrR family transcriptional regulator
MNRLVCSFFKFYLCFKMKKESVDERIMQTATRLFYTQGYNLTGINQLIEEAGIAKPSLYNKYRSKTDVLLAYLDNQSVNLFNGLEAHLAGITGARNKIIGIFELSIACNEAMDFGGCPFLKVKAEVAPSEKEVLDKVLATKNRLRQLFLQLVTELDDKKGFSDKALADMLYFMLEGSRVSASINKQTADIESALDTIKRII